MNKDKIIKDLKERNNKLANQSRQHEIRELNYLLKCEQLENELKSIKENYKIQLEYDKQLETRIDKATKYIDDTTFRFLHIDDLEKYTKELREDLLKILKKEKNNE